MCKIVLITLIICTTVFLCILVPLIFLCCLHKRKIELKNEHEKNLIELEFKNKKEREEMIQVRYILEEYIEKLKDAENFDAEIKKVEKIYQLLKDKIS